MNNDHWQARPSSWSSWWWSDGYGKIVNNDHWQARLQRQYRLTVLAIFEYLFLRTFQRLPVEWEVQFAEAIIAGQMNPSIFRYHLFERLHQLAEEAMAAGKALDAWVDNGRPEPAMNATPPSQVERAAGDRGG